MRFEESSLPDLSDPNDAIRYMGAVAFLTASTDVEDTNELAELREAIETRVKMALQILEVGRD